MSWLARSLSNSLGIDDHGNQTWFSDRINQQLRPHEEDEVQSHGVKEDLSEFKETLTRQLVRVANFLTPQPPSPAPLQVAAPDKSPDQIAVSEFDPSVSGDDGLSDQDQVAGESGDPSDVGGVAAGEIHRFPDNDRAPAVPDNLQLRTSYAQLGSRVEEPDWIHKAVGLTNEVLSFAGNIGHHPETWLDFPIEEEDDLDDSVVGSPKGACHSH